MLKELNALPGAAMRIDRNPPAIVVEAELNERQLVQGIARAALRDHWSVGRYALELRERFNLTDAAIAEAVNTSDPDSEVGGEYVRQARTVAAKFPTRVGGCSWTHHREALRLDPERAEQWLRKAAAGKWSLAEMVRRIEARRRTESAGPDIEEIDERAFRAFLRDLNALADPEQVSKALKRWGGLLCGEAGQQSRLRLRSLVRNVTRILEVIDGTKRTKPRKSRKAR